MARVLNSNDSAARCLNCIRRHQRLIKQVANDNVLIQQIRPEYIALDDKVKIKNKKEIVREDAYDDLFLSDRNLDDAVRTVFEECKQFDGLMRVYEHWKKYFLTKPSAILFDYLLP